MTYANKKLSELTLDECKELIQHDDDTQAEYLYENSDTLEKNGYIYQPQKDKRFCGCW